MLLFQAGLSWSLALEYGDATHMARNTTVTNEDTSFVGIQQRAAEEPPDCVINTDWGTSKFEDMNTVDDDWVKEFIEEAGNALTFDNDNRVEKVSLGK